MAALFTEQSSEYIQSEKFKTNTTNIPTNHGNTIKDIALAQFVATIRKSQMGAAQPGAFLMVPTALAITKPVI